MRPSNWLTSESARDARPPVCGLLVPLTSSDGVAHGSLMSSVKSDKMEKSDESVPPVETSLIRV